MPHGFHLAAESDFLLEYPDIQATVQLPDHLQSQRALMVQDFINSIQASYHRL
jgi:hypothetical protein